MKRLRRAGAAAVLPAVLLLHWAPTVPAQPVPVRIEADQVRYPGIELNGVTARWADGTVEVQVAELKAADLPVHAAGLRLSCAYPEPQSDLPCAAAPWSLDLVPVTAAGAPVWTLPISGQVAGLAVPGGANPLTTSLLIGDWSGLLRHWPSALEVEWDDQAASHLGFLSRWAEPFAWLKSGTSSGTVRAEFPAAGAARASLRIRTRALGFDSPDGRFAAEGLDLTLEADVSPRRDWRTSLRGQVGAGQLLVDDFYTDFAPGGTHFDLTAAVSGEQLDIAHLQLGDGRSLELQARAQLPLHPEGGAPAYAIERLDLQFPEAYHRYLEPLASAWTLDGLSVTGRLSWQGAHSEEILTSGILEINDLSVVDQRRQRFALTGFEARVQPGASGLDSSLSWRGLLFGRVNLGPGQTRLMAESNRLALAEPLRLGVLGGSVALEKLEVEMEAPGARAGESGETDITLELTLDDLDMAELTTALNWPRFDGRISGTIPGVTLADGVLDFAGQIRFRVFDGDVVLSGLSIERPFGVLPSLAANLDFSGLDLQLLTSAFSFGRISGRLDGYVHDLRMLDWAPVAFDAWMTSTPESSRSREISRQAVHNLTSLGGGSATAALAGPVLRLFNNFSYRALGIGCRLGNNVCVVRGLESEPNSVLIMEGSGVPKIMIRAYNRQMDWPQLVANLAAASSGEEIRIGD